MKETQKDLGCCIMQSPLSSTVINPASEHVFSLLKQSLSERQTRSLQDYTEASLMLQYNKH